MTVSWRASTGNLNAIRKSFVERSKGRHLSPETTAWYKATIAGLQEAIAQHKPLWVIRPQSTSNKDRPIGGTVQDVRAPIFVLTDAACMSACLDAVDLWKRLGAITIGRETSADTLYMEVRQIPLPAGVGAVSMPMKAYAGRSRGSNEPVVPRYRFNGDIANTAALERWIVTLPEYRRRPPGHRHI